MWLKIEANSKNPKSRNYNNDEMRYIHVTRIHKMCQWCYLSFIIIIILCQNSPQSTTKSKWSILISSSSTKISLSVMLLSCSAILNGEKREREVLIILVGICVVCIDLLWFMPSAQCPMTNYFGRKSARFRWTEFRKSNNKWKMVVFSANKNAYFWCLASIEINIKRKSWKIFSIEQ